MLGATRRSHLRMTVHDWVAVVQQGSIMNYQTITVETRGHLLKLGVDPATGKTIVTAHERVEQSPGVRVRIWLPPHISKADITPACNSCVCNFG